MGTAVTGTLSLFVKWRKVNRSLLHSTPTPTSSSYHPQPKLKLCRSSRRDTRGVDLTLKWCGLQMTCEGRAGEEGGETAKQEGTVATTCAPTDRPICDRPTDQLTTQAEMEQCSSNGTAAFHLPRWSERVSEGGREGDGKRSARARERQKPGREYVNE